MRYKKIFLMMLLLLLSVTLIGCKTNHYDIKEYILEEEYTDNFRILQFTDIHLANKDDRDRQYQLLQSTIDQANANMIVVTGDMFTFADKRTVKELFAFFDKQGIPWTVTFGNHDEQCYFSIEWLTRFLNKYESNCLFIDHQDDDIFGNANFAINLMKDNKPFEQIILLDSNRYNYGEYIGYDYIKDTQIELYENIINYTTEQNNGNVVDSIMFFHIPLPEWNDAYEAYERGEAQLILGTKLEDSCSPKYNSGLFTKVLELHSTKCISVGHDHLNDNVILYKGVYLSYGLNSTDRIYFDESKVGGRVITIKPDHSLEFENVYSTYGD